MTSVTSAEVKRWLVRAFVVGLASALGLTALAYAIDFAVFRYRVATNRQPYGQITVTSYDAVPQKSQTCAGNCTHVPRAYNSNFGG